MEPEEMLLDCARTAAEQGRLDEAQKLYLHILECYPRTPEAEAAISYLLNRERRSAMVAASETPKAETRRKTEWSR